MQLASSYSCLRPTFNPINYQYRAQLLAVLKIISGQVKICNAWYHQTQYWHNVCHWMVTCVYSNYPASVGWEKYFWSRIESFVVSLSLSFVKCSLNLVQLGIYLSSRPTLCWIVESTLVSSTCRLQTWKEDVMTAQHINSISTNLTILHWWVSIDWVLHCKYLNKYLNIQSMS